MIEMILVQLEKLISRRERLKKKVDKLTRFLCTALRWMEDKDCEGDSVNEFLSDNNEIKDWWLKHQLFDRARTGADKLSKEESKALLEYVLKNRQLP